MEGVATRFGFGIVGVVRMILGGVGVIVESVEDGVIRGGGPRM